MSIDSSTEQVSGSIHLPPPGTVIADRFRIVEMVGRGGMGVVYRAEHIHLQKEMAVKMLLGDFERDGARFSTEARIASMLDHPNIVRVHDFGVLSNGYPYLAMDFLAGRSLDDELKQIVTMPLDRFRTIFLQVCDALEHAHQAGVVHRDIKPSNIMLVTRNRQSDVVKIVDFGLVKVKRGNGTDQKLTSTNTLVGSPLFMSPEQCRGMELDHRSDIYSLGCVMYRALTGSLPVFGDNPLDTLYKHVSEPPLPMSKANSHANVPPELECVVMKALCKTPEARQRSMEELRLELERALPGDVVKAQASSSHHPVYSSAVAPETLANVSRLRESAILRTDPPTPPTGVPPEGNKQGRKKWHAVAVAGVMTLGAMFFLAAMKQGKPLSPRVVADDPVKAMSAVPVTKAAERAGDRGENPAMNSAATSGSTAIKASQLVQHPNPLVRQHDAIPAEAKPNSAHNLPQAENQSAPVAEKRKPKPSKTLPKPIETVAPDPVDQHEKLRAQAQALEKEGTKKLDEADFAQARSIFEKALAVKDNDEGCGPSSAGSMVLLAKLVETSSAMNDLPALTKYFWRFCNCWTEHPNPPVRGRRDIMRQMADVAVGLAARKFHMHRAQDAENYMDWAKTFADGDDDLRSFVERRQRELMPLAAGAERMMMNFKKNGRRHGVFERQ